MLKGVAGFIKALLSLVIKGAAWLLLTLGLWLPCLYALVFLVATALCGASLGSLMRPFVVGTVLSLIAGMLISYYLSKKRAERAQVVKLSGRKLKRDAAAASDSPDESQNAGGAAQPSVNVAGFNQKAGGEEDGREGALPPRVRAANGEENPARAWESAAEQSSAQDAARLKEKYFYSGSSLLDGNDSGLGYDYEEAARKKLLRLSRDEEQPLVFRSKNYSDIYIYEFSDRLQIYRRTARGMTLIEVREKPGREQGGREA